MDPENKGAFVKRLSGLADGGEVGEFGSWVTNVRFKAGGPPVKGVSDYDIYVVVGRRVSEERVNDLIVELGLEGEKISVQQVFEDEMRRARIEEVGPPALVEGIVKNGKVLLRRGFRG